MTNIVAEYQKLIQQKRDLAGQIKANGAAILAEGARAIFDAHAVVGAFGWVQYTPSFNDGDPCKFTRGETFILTPTDAGNEDYERDDPEDSSDEFSPYSNRNHEGHRLDETLYRSPSGELTTWQGKGYTPFSNPDYDPVYGGARNAVNAFVEAFDNELLEAIFGEYGAKITITREGVDVTEYDCGY